VHPVFAQESVERAGGCHEGVAIRQHYRIVRAGGGQTYLMATFYFNRIGKLSPMHLEEQPQKPIFL
jgi:hypothetical protein